MNYLKSFILFVVNIWKSRQLILELTKKEFQIRYLGSYLGILWAFIQPTITIFIFWFIFQIGFRTVPIDNFPFILWLITGLVPWMFFSESISSSTFAIISNAYLVKKVVFRVSILPLIKILSALVIHLFFLIMVFIMFILYRFTPSLYYLQIFYYLFATLILVLGISWITSSLQVFLMDIGHLVNTFIQFGFWLTPVFWSIKILPQKYLYLIKLNPVFYIIEGYRNSLIYHIGFLGSSSMDDIFLVYYRGVFRNRRYTV